MRRILFAYEGAADNITVQSGRPYSILAQMCARADVVKLYLRSLARQVEGVVHAHACDVVFSPGSRRFSRLDGRPTRPSGSMARRRSGRM